MTPDGATAHDRSARIALRPHPAPDDQVAGAWWPQSTDLSEQLPALFDALATQMKTIVRVIFHIDDWVQPLSRMRFDDNLVRLDGYRYWPSGAIRLRGMDDKDALTLMVIPPDTTPPAAALVIEAASHDGDPMTVESLLELCGPVSASRHL